MSGPRGGAAVIRARLVVFDLDGTLVDSTADLATAVNAMLGSLGGAPLPLAQVRRAVGDGAASLVARSLKAAGLSQPLETALPVFLDAYRRCLLDTTRLYPGVAETLDALSDRTLAVLTNKPGDLSRTILAGLGVAGRFARIWGGGDVPGRKPDPAGLQGLMRELGAGPAQTVLVGDSPVDVRTARAGGVRFVGVSYGLDPDGLAAEAPDDLRLDDLRRLPRLV